MSKTSPASKTVKRQRKTKIVATLGPASSHEAMIRALFLAGVDVFRLNFSHGIHADHEARLNTIRKLEQEYRRPIAVLADLQGPKLRIGVFAKEIVTLKKGQAFRLDMAPVPGDETRVALPHPEIMAVMAEGEDLLLDDGRVMLRVMRKANDDAGSYLDTKVIYGNTLSSRKGVNVPGVVLPLSALTEKDRRDLDFALSLGVDWVALSFVQKAADLVEAKDIIQGRAALMAKIEKPSAVTDLAAIIKEADGIMVARGDLGVEMPPENVPVIQKMIERMARAAGKPLIVATQMLESMVTAPAATRAEVSDVATAIYDGSDAIMLSAETASGAYPLEAVSLMNRIAKKVEADPLYRAIVDAARPTLEATGSDAITHSARATAETIKAALIVTCTLSGSTALRAARERPTVPIMCLTSSMQVARRLVLSYGVYSYFAPDIEAFEGMIEKAAEIAVKDGLARSGQKLVITAGLPFGIAGSTNILRILKVD